MKYARMACSLVGASEQHPPTTTYEMRYIMESSSLGKNDETVVENRMLLKLNRPDRHQALVTNSTDSILNPFDARRLG